MFQLPYCPRNVCGSGILVICQYLGRKPNLYKLICTFSNLSDTIKKLSVLLYDSLNLHLGLSFLHLSTILKVAI